jgi:SAM-dependent methyltransferase
MQIINKMHKYCIICKSEDMVTKYIINGFHIAHCKSCSLLFVAEKISREELCAYYNNEIASEKEYAYVDEDNIINLRAYYNKLAAFINGMVTKGRILDVGCSAGHFFDCMPGWECYGIEPVAFQAEKAKERYGDNIHIGTLEDCKYPIEYFDVITLQDSLDHMPDPLAAIRKCRTLLNSRGLLVIKVHDFSCVFAKIMRSKFYAFIPPFHLVYFNEDSLFKTLAISGFKIEQYKHITQQIYFKTIFFRLSRNNKNSIFYHLYKLINHTPFKDIKVKKNLHDIITVFARK